MRKVDTSDSSGGRQPSALWLAFGYHIQGGTQVEINLTAAERAVRLFALPTALMLLGLVLLAFIGGAMDTLSPMVRPTLEAVIVPARWFLAGLSCWGALWFAWRLVLLYRWENGADGGCHHCCGFVRHLEGRWGDYSKCMMCGGTKSGRQ